ncbi:MAG: hypothetical protein Q9211_005153 [Gyalolechia sp. 1 TL-2023]
MSEETARIKTPLTQRETEHVVMAIQCLKDGNLPLDWDKFVIMADFKNRASANSSFGSLVRSKLSPATIDNHYVAHSSPAANTVTTPKKRTPKAKAAAADKADNNDTGTMIPKKRGRKQGSEAPAAKRGKLLLKFNKHDIVDGAKDDHEEKVEDKVEEEPKAGAGEELPGGESAAAEPVAATD